MAENCDKESSIARREGKLDELDPLHGIPFSVKDMFEMKGFLNTIGSAWHGFDIRQQDSLIVKLYKKAGGIPLIRGNMPQSGLSMHTDNWLWGDAKNPHNS